MVTVQSDFRSPLQMAKTFRHLRSNLSLSRATSIGPPAWAALPFGSALRMRAFSTAASGAGEKVTCKPPTCTADELHYVSVSNSDWRLALWRYTPPPQAPKRNHPLLLLSGVGTNAVGYDLSPRFSFARYMSGQGFDTWILEVRGAGLSMQKLDNKEMDQSVDAMSEQIQAAAMSETSEVISVEQQSTSVSGSSAETQISVIERDVTGTSAEWDESILVTKLTETFMRLSERLSGFLSEGQSKIISAKLFDQISKLLEGSQLSDRFNEIRVKLLSLLESRQNSAIGDQIRDLSERLVNVIEEGQLSVSPQLFDLQELFSTKIEDFQKQLELIVKYDWDFDHYLEEDVPAAMEYIRAQSKPKDGKLLAIGHSMGGILLYAMQSRCVVGSGSFSSPGIFAVRSTQLEE